MLSLVSVACGDGGGVGTLPDAPRAPDAAVPNDAPIVQPVTLTITNNATPVAGIHTYFLNADSTVVKTVDTDATGTASATMVAGGSVTAINPFVAPPGAIATDELRTFAGVKPGDHLVLTQTTDSPPSISFQLTVPAMSGTTSYSVFTSCGNGAISVNNSQLAGIAGVTGPVTLSGCNGVADILIVATGVVGVEPFAVALYRANVAVADAVAVDFRNDQPPDVYNALTAVTFGYTNVPAATTQIGVVHMLSTSRGPIFSTSSLAPAIIDGTTASVTLNEPSVSGTIGMIGTLVFTDSFHVVFQRRPVTATSTFDLAGLLADIVGQPFYKTASKHLSWNEGAIGVAADLTLAEIDVSQQTTPPRAWNWHIAAPYTPGGELTFPTLPTDVVDWAARAEDQVNVASLINLKVPGGYDAARAHVHDADLASLGQLAVGPNDTVQLVQGGSVPFAARAGSPVLDRAAASAGTMLRGLLGAPVRAAATASRTRFPLQAR